MLAYTSSVPKHAGLDECRKWCIKDFGGYIDCKITYGRKNIDQKICCNSTENMSLFISDQKII